MKKLLKVNIRKLGIALIALLIVLVSLLIWLTLQKPVDRSSIISRVAHHMVLPSDVPVVAEVVDVDKIQSSLKKIAEKGDYILLYDKKQKVIVYRPSSDKIIDVQPILYGKQPNASIEYTIAIYNGSGDDKKLKSFIKNVYTMYPNLQLVVKETAPRSFPTTIVFTKDGTSEISQQFADSLSIKDGITPNGIDTNVADIIFIVGTDYAG